MKGFLLFAGELCYPEGGANDLVGRYNSRYDAEDALAEVFGENLPEWAHVFDCDENEIISRFRKGKWEGPWTDRVGG
jgi:hypothetical protein